jgi:hypothetical protein
MHFNTRLRVAILVAFVSLITAVTAAVSGAAQTTAGSYTIRLAHIFHVKVPADAMKHGWCYDVGVVDPSTHEYFLADAANKEITTIKPASHAIAGIGTGLFTGIANCHKNQFDGQGPNGLAIYGSSIYGGNGDSRVFGFPLQGGSRNFNTSTQGKLQADELTVAGKYLVVSNGADIPHPFLSFLDAAGKDQKVLGKYTFSNATGSLGQLDWWGGHLYVAVATSDGSPKGGEIDELDVSNVQAVKIVRRFTFKSCQPSGLAIGGNGLAAIGCGPPAPQAVLNLRTGAQTTVNGIQGVDITAAHAGDFFYVSFITNKLYVVNSAGTTLQSFGVMSSHTVSVDPSNGDVWVPEDKGVVALYQPKA